jgi:hypothetical protein
MLIRARKYSAQKNNKQGKILWYFPANSDDFAAAGATSG